MRLVTANDSIAAQRGPDSGKAQKSRKGPAAAPHLLPEHRQGILSSWWGTEGGPVLHVPARPRTRSASARCLQTPVHGPRTRSRVVQVRGPLAPSLPRGMECPPSVRPGLVLQELSPAAQSAQGDACASETPRGPPCVPPCPLLVPPHLPPGRRGTQAASAQPLGTGGSSTPAPMGTSFVTQEESASLSCSRFTPQTMATPARLAGGAEGLSGSTSGPGRTSRTGSILQRGPFAPCSEAPAAACRSQKPGPLCFRRMTPPESDSHCWGVVALQNALRRPRSQFRSRP